MGARARTPGQPDLRTLLLAREPLVYWSILEEERALAEVERAALRADLPIRRWSPLRGLSESAGADSADSADLAAALRELLDAPREELVLIQDPDAELERPAVLRGLRDLAQRGPGGPCLLLLGREAALPKALRPEAVHLVQPNPSLSELRQLFRSQQEHLPLGALGKEGLERLVNLARGLPLRRVRRLLRAELAGEVSVESLRAALLAARREAVAEVGVLELVSPLPSIEQIGGLEGLKEWLEARRELFSPELAAAGLPIPRGILLMGVSGCGKSLAAKACASLWELPLYRLDMNLVFSGMHGSPEASFHRALRSLEEAAPAVLWIDELENGLGSREGGGVEAPEHLFSAFLTWLQEKPPLIFVAATANRIEALPAEVLRKGRFDQVFFLDLPNETERRAILEIHLARHGLELAKATLDYVVYDTRRWSGAELEQAVISARVRAQSLGREVQGEDLLHVVQGSVPLSRTMHEQIRALREWAFGRAAPASHESAQSAGDAS